MQKINERKSWFFVKVNKVDKPLANLTKDLHQEIRNAKGEIKTSTKEIQGIIKDYFENNIPINLKILK
jgi:uncharacterized protein YaaR (DUF327 family)